MEQISEAEVDMREMMRVMMERMSAALGFCKCPRCGSTKVAVKKVSRGKGQCDGLSGFSYKCQSCSFQWVKPSCPVV